MKKSLFILIISLVTTNGVIAQSTKITSSQVMEKIGEILIDIAKAKREAKANSEAKGSPGNTESTGSEKTPNPSRLGTNCPGLISPVPVFNYFPVTFDDTSTPLCHDFPVIDAALDTTNPQFSQSAKELRSIRKYKIGDQIAVMLFINNGAASNYPPSITTAKNVKIRTSTLREGSIYTLSARYSGDNVALPKADNIQIEVKPNEALEIVPKSGYMYNYEGKVILDQQNLDLGNSTFTLGDLDADWEYSLFLTFKVRVVKKK